MGCILNLNWNLLIAIDSARGRPGGCYLAGAVPVPGESCHLSMTRTCHGRGQSSNPHRWSSRSMSILAWYERQSSSVGHWLGRRLYCI